MTVVNPKSISGITSITTASGSDNLLTIHTSDASSTERVRINSSGDVIVGSGITVSPDGDIFTTGVTTATTFVGALTGNVTGNISGGTVAGSTGTFTGDVDIADKIIHTGDTNTAIRFPVNDNITFETGGSEALRVDSGGRLLVGTNAARTFGGGVYAHLQLEGTTQQGSQFTVTRNSNDTYSPNISLVKTRGTSDGAVTTVQDNDKLGTIQFRGADGSDVFAVAADINAEVDGSPSDGTDMPGALVFGTTADGAASPTERLRITSAGKVGINLAAPTRPLHIASDEDLTSFTGTTKGAFCISNNDYANGEYSAIDFTYTGSDNPIGRIATKITSGGSSLHFGTSNNYSSGITNEALMITSGGDVGIGDNNPSIRLTVVDSGTENLVRLGRSDGSSHGSHTVNIKTSKDFYHNFKMEASSFDLDCYNGSSMINALTIDSAGEVVVNSGDLRFGSSGKGIVLGNTSNADANTLDDYEEGTFSPEFTMTGGGQNLTYSTQVGTYTKIGNVVTIEIFITVTGINANGSGNLRISNLPFTKTGSYGGMNISYLTNLNNVEITHALVDINSTNIFLYTFSGGGVSNASVAASLTTNSQIMVNGIYHAA